MDKGGLKRVITIGAAGGVSFLAVDYAVGKLYLNDDGTENTDDADREMKRGAVALVVGVGGGLLLRKMNRDLALGVAAGGVAAGVKRLNAHYHWTDDEQSSGYISSGARRVPVRALDAGGYSARSASDSLRVALPRK